MQDDLQEVVFQTVLAIMEKVHADRVICFGQGGGGFAALQLAGRFGASATAVCINPQTHIHRYNSKAVAAYERVAWHGAIPESVEYNLQTSLTEGRVPGAIYYLQNLGDVWHIRAQLAGYLEALQGVANSNKHMVLFEDWGDGHVGPPKDRTREIMELVVRGDTPFDFIKEGFELVRDVNIRDRVKGLMSPNGLDINIINEAPVVYAGVSNGDVKSTITRESYRTHFPFPGVTSTVPNEIEPDTFEIILAAGGKVLVSVDELRNPEFWTQAFPNQHDSNMLWLRSCIFAVSLAESGNIPLAIQILKSYNGYLTDHELHYIKLRMNSLDHCLAMNLRVCAWMTTMYDLADDDQKVVDDLLTDLLTLTKSYDFFLPYNHGLMLALSLIHVATLCNVRVPNELSLSRATAFLCATFDKVVAENGYVRENSVSYQYYWTGWTKEVANTFGYLLDNIELATYFERKRNKILEASSTMAVSQFLSLPLGDGSSEIQAVSTPVSADLDIVDEGLFIRNHGNGSAFSFRAGTRSTVHKHADDLSICLFIDSDQVVADAGFNSYDINDPISRCVTSQRGHSSLVFPDFDDIAAQEFYPRAEPTKYSSGSLHLLEKTDEIVKLRGTQSIQQNYFLKRDVTYQYGLQRIVLDDFAEYEGDSHPRTPVARFLIPSSFSFREASSNKFVFDNEKLVVRFIAEPRCSVALKFGDRSGVQPFGIICPRSGRPEGAWLLEIKLEASRSDPLRWWQSCTLEWEHK